jgi:hypothetical protein
VSSKDANPVQLGERQFTDGTTRLVYRSEDGRQYILDDDGEPVYRVWLYLDTLGELISNESLAVWPVFFIGSQNGSLVSRTSR